MTDDTSNAGQTLDPQSTADAPWPDVGQTANPAEGPGSIIGHYKLLQRIGEGGCGVVYMAEQEQPVRRRVALKVIKLGMDTRQVVARFEAERQALAMMDHPNIARVLDAGATETGRPYFVMELVRGVPITDYCDKNNLPTQRRLELFISVCQAIQHAHQKGIIHRDIKPTNILVTLHDGVPVPKVIDFGIAKATDQRLTDKTLFTAFEQFIGTPAYMSPEQAEMSGLDIDTRADIYALGVLLYELLTGRTPFDAKELMASGLDEMRRTIREREPARPSTKLSTMLDGDLSTVATRRQIEPAKLASLIRGDLDWIVMKSLEKDRTRRFDTAAALAMDVQHYLKNEPVSARPPTLSYRFRKFVRRNKTLVTAGGLVAASLLLGFTFSIVLLFEERAALQRAVKAEQKQTHTLDQMKRLERLQAVLKRLKERQEWTAAESPLRESLAIQRDLMGNEQWRIAMSLADLAEVLQHEGKLDLVEAPLLEAVATGRHVLSYEGAAPNGIDPLVFADLRIYMASLFVWLADVYRDQHQPAKAELLLRELIALDHKHGGGQRNEAVARGVKKLADLLEDQGKTSEAEELKRAYRDSQAKDRLTALRRTGAEFSVEQADDGTLDVQLNDQPTFTDLSPLKGEPISRLAVMRTGVSDLTPLRGMALKALWLAETKVTDLSPLTRMKLESLQVSKTAVSDLSPIRNMPLRSLNMTDCAAITNLSPIAEMTTLESLILPPNVKDVEFLRKFPRLKRLGYRFDATLRGPDQTAEEFWAQLDRSRQATNP